MAFAIANEQDIKKMIGNIYNKEYAMAKCACVSCNSCTCGCSCRLTQNDSEDVWN